ncbi:MAG: hypothetical protein J6035_01225 [Bacteroidaceae bacterium]|nr:hypothetical protein [Bacteroidaceae bacterium]
MADELKNLRNLQKRLMSDEDDKQRFLEVMQSLSINGQWFKKQLGVIALILVGVIIYVTNRYQAQQEIIEEESLQKELDDWKYRCLTRNSELTLKTRQSKVEDLLKQYGDSTITIGIEPPYALR